MKYAIFSDIHGNIHALRAALSDAKVQGAQRYIFLGDYVYGFPWGNDVVNTIRGLEPAMVIRGNGEGYLIDLHDKRGDQWVHEQFKPTYWAYNSLSNDNLEYLLGLPETAGINNDGEAIHINHALNIFYRQQKIAPFHSGQLREIFMEPFSHDQYLETARNAVMARCDVLEEILDLPKGVYLFGHNHLQFHMEHEGRLFINPGSCGKALDCDTTAAYTLLNKESSRWVVIERRVEYDLDATAEELRTSGYVEYAPVWSEVMNAELMTGMDHFLPFVLHLIETGRRLNQTGYPVSNEVWHAATRSLDVSKL